MAALPEDVCPDSNSGYEEAGGGVAQVRPMNGDAREETPACQSCRKKKSRCSRQQPCAQCVKSGVECTYEDRRLKGGIKTGVVERLNQRIDALENMFLGQGILLQQFMRNGSDGNHGGGHGNGQAAWYPPVSLTTVDGEAPTQLRLYTDKLKDALSAAVQSSDVVHIPPHENASISRASAAASTTTAASMTAARATLTARANTTTTTANSAGKHRRDFEPFIPSKRRAALDSSLRADDDDNDLCAIHPLPKPIEEVLAVYFRLVHPWMPVLHPATFSQRVRDPDRPACVTMILHAIVAVAAKYVKGRGGGGNGGGEDGSTADNDDDEARYNTDLGEYAALCRQRVVDAAMAEASSIYAIQALLLVVFDTLNTGRSASPWSLVALITRKIKDLQLFREDHQQQPSSEATHAVYGDFFTASPAHLHQQPAATWFEVEEQRRVFWMSFLMDRFCSISTGSTPMIASRSIRRRLPCDGCMWERGQAVETSYFQTDDQLQNEEEGAAAAAATIPPTLDPCSLDSLNNASSSSSSYANHSNNIGGLAYTTEAAEALCLIAEFNLCHPLQPKNASQLSAWLNRFRQLDSQLLQWDLSLTQKWRDVRVVNGYIDPNLTQAHLTHNAAVILLHRTLAHPQPQTRMWLSGLISTASRESCITAALKIDKISRRYLAVSDGIVPPQFSLSLFIGGQVLLAQASYFTMQPPDEVGSIVASLHEVARRLSADVDVDTDNGVRRPENPASRLARALADQRDHICMPATSSQSQSQSGQLGTDSVPWQPKASMFPDFYQVDNANNTNNQRDVPNVLQHCLSSVSSGVSPNDLVSFRQDDSVTNLEAQSILPSGVPGGGGRNLPPWPMSNGMGRQDVCDASAINISPANRESDLFAQIRRLEPRGREPG